MNTGKRAIKPIGLEKRRIVKTNIMARKVLLRIGNLEVSYWRKYCIKFKSIK